MNRWTRKAFATSLFGLLLSAAQPSAAVDLQELRDSVNAGTVGLLSARADSTFTRLADNMGIALDASDLRILTTLGGGSLQNVEDLLALRGIDVAFTQADTLFFYERVDAFPGVKDVISYIAKVHDEEFHLLARTSIKDISDLEGLKVNFGKPGTGTFLTSSVVFDKLALDVEVTDYPHKKAYELLREGKIDAMAKVDGKPVGLIQDASLDHQVHLLNVPAEQLIGSYDAATLSSGDYPSLIAAGDTIDTVSVPSLLAAYKWPADHPRGARVNRFIEALFANIDALKDPVNGYDPKWAEINLSDEVPGWSRADRAAELLSTQ